MLPVALLLLAGLLLNVSLLIPGTCFADEYSHEQEMKAALVFKLTRFISWPDESADVKMQTLTICSSVNDPISPYLDSLKDKVSYTRTINILHTDDIEKIKSECRVLYVSRSRMPDGIYKLKSSPVLTISDQLGFAKQGGMIQITRRNKRLRFHINHASALQAGIKISAPLLKMATIIKNSNAGETK